MSKKRVYLRHRCFLPKGHPYQEMKFQFDGMGEKVMHQGISVGNTYMTRWYATPKVIDPESIVLGK